MAFVAGSAAAARVIIPAGGPAPNTVQVPHIIDLSTNGYGGNQYSHYMVVSAGTTGSGQNTALTSAGGIVFALQPGNSSVVVNSNTAADTVVLFGKMD